MDTDFQEGVPAVTKVATAEKRQRRERGSINPNDIVNGAFELAEQVSIDNLSMPMLSKHLDVGVTSIYWYFRKKDDLLDAMTDLALRQYVLSTPYAEAENWRSALRNHAHAMRQTYVDNPIMCDLIRIRSAHAAHADHSTCKLWNRPSPAWSKPGWRRRPRSMSMRRSHFMCVDRLCFNVFGIGQP